MNEAWEIRVVVRNMIAKIQEWVEYIGVETLVTTILLILVVTVFRKPLSKLVIKVTVALLDHLSIKVSDEVREKVTEACGVLLVTLTFFIAVEILAPPEFAGGFLRKLVISIFVLAVFSTWYELAGPFLEVLSKDRFLSVTMETGWVERLTKFAILMIGITALLKVWDIDISGALTGVGVLGAGLAIAAQDLVRNLIAGMTNMSEKRFVTGDAIEVPGGVSGVVKRIDLRSTLIVGFDQIPRFVPNSELSNAVVSNYTILARRRVLMKIPLIASSTRAQIEEVRDGLKTYLLESGDFALDGDAPQYVTVEEFSQNAFVIQFYACTNKPGYVDYLETVDKATLATLDMVRAAGTEFARPIQIIHLENDPASGEGQAAISSDS